MSKGLKLWLKRRLDRMVSVQNTYIQTPNADVTIQLWSGVLINLHFIKEIPKTRNIKNILKYATSAGVSSLFVLDAQLFPDDGHRFEPKEWLQAFTLLTNDFIYAYRIINQKVSMFQVHFEPITGSSKEYRVWFGPEIPFERLRHYRASVKPRFLRGDWLVADFDTPPFWRNNDYRHYRNQQERVFARQRSTRWETWSAYQQTWTNVNGGGKDLHPNSPLRNHLEQCYALLGVEYDAPQESVKRAFRKRAIDVHPDTSDLPEEEARQKFRRLSEAYEYIKAARGWS